MSVTSEIVVASRDDIAEIANLPSPSQVFSGMISTGILDADLSVLYTILLDEEWTEKHLEAIEQVYEGSEQGPWIFLVPQQLQNILSAMSENDLSITATKWSETDEFVLKGYGEVESSFLVQSLHNLASEAEEKRINMFLLLAL